MLSRLRREFYNLKYIIHNKHYLIPPPPRSIASVPMIWSILKSLEINKQHKEIPYRIIKSQLFDHYSANRHTDSEILHMTDVWTLKQRRFYQESAEYYRKYLLPLSKPMNGYTYFLQVTNLETEPGVLMPQELLLKKRQLYKNLTPEELEKYKKIAAQINRERDAKYKEIRKRLRVPRQKILSSFNMFVAESMRSMSEITELSRIWRLQSASQKAEYRYRGQQRRKEIKQSFNTFLQPFGINQEQLANIVRISKQYKKELLRIRRARRQTLLRARSESQSETLLPEASVEQLEDDEDIWLQDHLNYDSDTDYWQQLPQKP